VLGQFITVIQGCAPAALVLAVMVITGRALSGTAAAHHARQISAKSGGRSGPRVALRPAAWGGGAGALAGAALAALRESALLRSREAFSAWTAGTLIVALVALVVFTWLTPTPATPLPAAVARRLAQIRRRDGDPAVPPSGGADSRQLGGSDNSPPGGAPDPALAGSASAAQSVAGAARVRGARRAWAAAAWSWTAALVAALVLARALPTVLLQFTSFVVPGEPIWSTDSALRAAGFVAGAVLVGIGGVALVRASQGTRPGTGRVALTAIAAIATLTAAVNLIQVFTSRQMIRLPRGAFNTLAWLINHQTALLAAAAVVGLALPSVMLVSNLRRGPSGPNPAARRLVKATKRRRLRYGVLTSGAYVALGLAVTVGVAIEEREIELSPPEPYELVEGAALVSLELVEDGHLHRFAYTAADGTEVRFIVIKKNGVAYGVGLDACEVCGPTGYYERDGKIVCRRCDVVMNIATIGFKGGCNPIPLEYTLDGDCLTVSAADLEAAASIFA
jgi:uncharacterized membrane protein